MLKKALLLLIAIGFLTSSCIIVAKSSRPTSGKSVRTWVRPNGCRVKEVTYYCYNSHGDVIWKIVTCPHSHFKRKTRRVYHRSDCPIGP